MGSTRNVPEYTNHICALGPATRAIAMASSAWPARWLVGLLLLQPICLATCPPPCPPPPPPTAAGDEAGAEEGDVVAPLIERGVEILLAMQETLGESEKPGEWPYEGVYRTGGQIPIGYRVGGTAIGAWSLLEARGYQRDTRRQAAVSRALDFILGGLDQPKMQSGFARGYDVRGWGHIYALNLMLRLRATESVPAGRAEAVDTRIKWLIQALEDTQIPVGGGWNYSRRNGFEKPGPASAFMTAPALLTLFEAARQGEAVNEGMLERALTALATSRNDEGAIPYAVSPGAKAQMPGAIGRTPVTEVVLSLAGRSDVDRIRKSVDAFFEHWEWLEKRRRQNGTHEQPYGIAPYYFFYAHYYVALAIEMLPEGDRQSRRAKLLARLLQVQEDSGGWNDRVFERSENYGTAMSILALRQPRMPRPHTWAPSAPAEKH